MKSYSNNIPNVSTEELQRTARIAENTNEKTEQILSLCEKQAKWTISLLGFSLGLSIFQVLLLIAILKHLL